MISKEEREKDRAILKKAPKGTWTNGDGKRKPGKSIFIAETAREEKDPDGTGRPSRYGPTRHYVCNAFTVEIAAAIAHAHNRLPAYIADAEEMEQRIAKIETLAPLRSGTVRDEGATLDMVLRILRGEL